MINVDPLSKGLHIRVVDCPICTQQIKVTTLKNSGITRVEGAKPIEGSKMKFQAFVECGNCHEQLRIWLSEDEIPKKTGIKVRPFEIRDMIDKQISEDTELSECPPLQESFLKSMANVLLNKETAVLEFKNRFSPYIDWVTAVGDGEFLYEGKKYHFKLWRRNPTQNQTVGINTHLIKTYKDTNTIIIFAIPNAANPQYYSKTSNRETDNHTFYLCNPNQIEETEEPHGVFYYVSLTDLINLDTVEVTKKKNTKVLLQKEK